MNKVELSELFVKLYNSMSSDEQVDILNKIQDNYSLLTGTQKLELKKWLSSHIAPLPLLKRKLGNVKFKTLTS